MKRLVFMVALVMVLGMGTLVQAALIDRGADILGNHLIYDTDLNITWYDYTKSLDSWNNQISWADNLIVTMPDGRIFTDWRLPTTVDGPPTYYADGAHTGGFNVTTSEMGHLFFKELGNKATFDKAGIYQSDYGLKNKGLFTNLQPVNYWSGTECAFRSNNAWYFSFRAGDQGVLDKGTSNPYNPYALAVRYGDFNSSSVPIPAAVWLFGTGLLGLWGMRRKSLK